MDTQLQSQKTLPKIKLSLFSVNFLKQKDSKILLTYVEELYQSAQLQNKEYLILKKEIQEQRLKHKKYIIKFKNKVRKLFKKYAEQNFEQLSKLKYVQSSSQEIQRLIKVAQNNNCNLGQENKKLIQINQSLEQENKKLAQVNQSLEQKNKKLAQINQNLDQKNTENTKNTEDLFQLKKEVLFSKKTHENFLAQQQNIKEKAIVALKTLENEIEKAKTNNEQNKKIIQIKDNYINKIQILLKENKKEMSKLNKENSELNIQSKVQVKNQNNLIIKLRQYQDAQEKLEQQKQALQKLNQNISLSLNQCRQQLQQIKNTEKKEFSFRQNSTEHNAGSSTEKHATKHTTEGKKPIFNVLANLYSSYNK